MKSLGVGSIVGRAHQKDVAQFVIGTKSLSFVVAS